MHTHTVNTARRSGFALVAFNLALGGLLLMLRTAAADHDLPFVDGPTLAIAFFAAASWTIAAWGPGRTVVSSALCACRWRRLRLFGMGTCILAGAALWLAWTCEGSVNPVHAAVFGLLLTLTVGARCRIRDGVHEKLLFSRPFSTEALP